MDFNYLNNEEFNKEMVKLNNYLPDNLMTLVIGIKCIDGVVLAGDRRFMKGHALSEGKKITTLFPNFTFGYSGTSEIMDKLLQNTKKYFEIHNPREDSIKFVNYLEDQIMLLNQRYSTRVGQLDMLYCDNIPGEQAKLFRVLCEGVNQVIQKFDAIGSGAQYALPFLYATYNNEMNMDKAVSLCTFILNLIDDTGMDIYIGGRPQILKIHDGGTFEELSDQKIDNLLRQSKAKEKLKAVIFD